jgi:hypothetical protein
MSREQAETYLRLLAESELAALCERLGIPGHGITAPPAADLPQRCSVRATVSPEEVLRLMI